MRVKHKDAKKEHSSMSMSLSHWQKKYYPNKKYLNYEFYDVPDIFDLFEINETNGNLTYIISDFSNVIFPKVRENPTKFVYKEHDPKYLDEYLMPVDKKNHSLLKKLITPSNTKRKAMPKKNDETSKLSKILNAFSNNKLLVGVLIAIIVALLNTNRIKNWINSIVDNF
jgi:hypothetical protein